MQPVHDGAVRNWSLIVKLISPIAAVDVPADTLAAPKYKIPQSHF
jgi:hypothetical protein